MFKNYLTLLVILMIGLWPIDSQGIVIKKILVRSVPSGAEVSLLQGAKRVYLGTTPFEYDLEFHSEVSILRLEFKKAGYEGKTIEVNAKQENVDVNLISQSLSVNPDTITDPMLRSLQQQLGPTINRTLPKLLASKGPYEFQLGHPVRVIKLDDKVFVLLSIELGKLKEEPSSDAQGKDEIFLKMVWDQFGQSMVIPLLKAVRGEHLLNGILLDVGYSHVRHGFEVGSHVESYTRMECLPGMESRQVYNPCIRHKIETYYLYGRQMTRDAGCEGGFETQMVYNPCLTKIPITHTEVKIDPKATTLNILSRCQYIFPMELIELAGKQDMVFSQLGILLTNEKGETVIKRGLIPSSLPRIPKNN